MDCGTVYLQTTLLYLINTLGLRGLYVYASTFSCSPLHLDGNGEKVYVVNSFDGIERLGLFMFISCFVIYLISVLDCKET